MQEVLYRLIDGILYAVFADTKADGIRLVRIGKI